MAKKMGIAEQREEFIIGCKFINRARKKYCNKFDVLGIDPARGSTGYCLHSPDTYVELEIGTTVPKTIGFSKVLKIENTVEFLLRNTKPFVVLEGYAMNAKWGREKAGELGGVIRRVLFLDRRPLLIVSPLTIKAWVKASSKSQIMLEILDKYKIKIPSDDAADAFVLKEIGHKALHLAFHVVRNKIRALDVKDYLRDEDYKERSALSKLYKYQANSLFKLICNQGRNSEFFLEGYPILENL